MGLLQTIRSLPQVRRNTRRFNEIAGVLLKYGLGAWMTDGTPDLLKKTVKTDEGRPIAELSKAECARMAFTELGTTFIKLGQVLSTRQDLVGAEFAAEMAKLQSSTPPDPPHVVRRIIEDELHQGVEEAFLSFEFEPMGSASIGQVHRAQLGDGTPLVVKVQHEGISDTVKNDLEILTVLADKAEKYSAELALYQPGRTVREFARSLLAELDYGVERSNIETFIENFERDETVRFPLPAPHLSSDRVLTMGLLEGTPVNKLDRLREQGVDPKAVARTGADVWINMILRDGFYHADPHPGNILACKDGTLSVLDCGMVGRIDDRTLEQFEDVVIALLVGDSIDLSRALLSICGNPPSVDRAAFETDVADFCSVYMGKDLNQIDFATAATAGTEVIRRNHLVLPSSIAQLLRTLVVLEGTSRALDHDFDLLELIEPYKTKILKRRLSPKYQLKKAITAARDYERLVRAFPREATEILERAGAGNFEVKLRHAGLETATVRLVYGLISASLFLGAAYLLGSRVPPLLGGLSIMGLGGGCVGAYLAWRAFKLKPRRH